MLRFRGERKEISTLFFEVRSFTDHSERHDAEQVVGILHEHLTRMVDAVFRNEGAPDKCVGDAVMAIFSASVAQPDHAVRACHTGLAMMAEPRQLEQKRCQEGKAPFRMGVGINTGEVIVDKLDSDQRFEYTVIRDPVNLAARVEGLNKESPEANCIIIGEFACGLAKDHIEARVPGKVEVKGKDGPDTTYELTGMRIP